MRWRGLRTMVSNVLVGLLLGLYYEALLFCHIFPFIKDCHPSVELLCWLLLQTAGTKGALRLLQKRFVSTHTRSGCVTNGMLSCILMNRTTSARHGPIKWARSCYACVFYQSPTVVCRLRWSPTSVRLNFFLVHSSSPRLLYRGCRVAGREQ